MIVEVVLPMLGETMDEGKIVEWLVSVGQSVKKGEPIFQVETDKAVLEVESPTDGVLRKIVHQAGVTVPVLTVVGLVAGPGEDISRYVAAGVEQVQKVVPSSGVPLVAGARVKRAGAQRIFGSPRARKLAMRHRVNLADVAGTGPGRRIVERDVQAYLKARPSSTPAARKVAAAAHLDVASVRGSGPGGRVTKEDVEAVIAEKASDAQRAKRALASPVGGISALTGLRGIIAERMSKSAQTTARVTLTTEVDATETVRVREMLKEQLGQQLGFSISYTDILVAVVAQALCEYTYLNVRLTDAGIEPLTHVNVGVAVDTERGLLVTVIRDADDKTITEIASTLRTLVARAREGKSTPDDLTGGSFTITNLGVYDIDAFTPIINLPECAILGIGRVQEKPAVHEGQVCVRQMMVLSLSFDHRLVDGAPAARFLQRIKELVEEPRFLLP